MKNSFLRGHIRAAVGCTLSCWGVVSAGHVWAQWCLFTIRPRGSHATILRALGSVGRDEEDGVWPLLPTPSSCGSRFQEQGRVGEAPVRRWVPACKLPTQHLHHGEAMPRLERETEPGTREMACKRIAQCHGLPHEAALSPRHEAWGACLCQVHPPTIRIRP